MDRMLKIESFKTGTDALIHVTAHGSANELISVMTDVILNLNDKFPGPHVKNAFWLTLNQCVCDELKERTLKR